ncbi:MAG: hypothetical protein RLZZ611_2332 [Cyanobacteriota bacterium]
MNPSGCCLPPRLSAEPLQNREPGVCRTASSCAPGTRPDPRSPARRTRLDCIHCGSSCPGDCRCGGGCTDPARWGALNALDPHNKARSVGPGHLPAQPWCLPMEGGSSCALFCLATAVMVVRSGGFQLWGGAAGAGTWGQVSRGDVPLVRGTSGDAVDGGWGTRPTAVPGTSVIR